MAMLQIMAMPQIMVHATMVWQVTAKNDDNGVNL